MWTWGRLQILVNYVYRSLMMYEHLERQAKSAPILKTLLLLYWRMMSQFVSTLECSTPVHQIPELPIGRWPWSTASITRWECDHDVNSKSFAMLYANCTILIYGVSYNSNKMRIYSKCSVRLYLRVWHEACKCWSPRRRSQSYCLHDIYLVSLIVLT